ncbi:DNA adenine methylase [Erwinia typographi]|uniref:Site-specific DNA-methyltransferase (adenine-specific) n=1 Tax=Erwinia typographi TaxID=371042 RepID=A0A0A3Z849_9GAMM|nr:DNA adenine methylase [Erwinia typographi]KGT95272.1 DNA adenine methylase [Erwinia typographi]
MNTILKWPGSKSRIMPEINKHLPEGYRLVEPFAGSCAVMMNTDFPAYLVADVNPDLINLYRQIKEFEQQFIIVAFRTFAENRSEESYYTIREMFNHHPGLPLLDRAAYFLYLNRNGYRGMCRYNQKGHFNVPFGNYSEPYFPLAEISSFAEKARRATFICADFTETLNMVKAGDVVYCDPPYHGTFTDYHGGGFGETQQYELASVLSDMANRHPVIASNSNTSLVKSLYRQFDLHQITAPRSIGVAAGKGKRAEEIIAVNRPFSSSVKYANPSIYPTLLNEVLP